MATVPIFPGRVASPERGRLKIALVNPPGMNGQGFVREGRCTQASSRWATPWPPISLACLAAILRERGCEPALLDCPAAGVDWRGMLAQLAANKPALILAPISTPSFAGDMFALDRLKQSLPGAKIGVFGVHATALDREILADNAFVDYVIRHEPEGTAADLPAVLRGEVDAATVKGLSFRGTAGPARNDDRPPIEPLDLLPPPAWDLVRLDHYRLPFDGRRFLSVAPLRGCAHRCTFCTAGAYYGRKLRLRSVESVLREIRNDVQAFGVRDFFMWAETFTIDRPFVRELAGAMRRETPVRWTCNSRLDTVDEELLRLMRDAGCWMIGFGIESTAPEVLANLKKDLRIGDPSVPLRQARAAGIRTVGHFILGLPGDTPDTVRKTISDAMSMDLDFVQFYAAAPFAGSELHREATAKGWVGDAAFSDMRQDNASLRLPGLPPEFVNAAIRRAVRRFYLRPRQILRILALAGLRGALREAFRRIKGKL
jgi:radical SAM superfamily enzyme YgiQ (UPF0313 family)